MFFTFLCLQLTLVRKGFLAGGGGCLVRMDDGIFSLSLLVVS